MIGRLNTSASLYRITPCLTAKTNKIGGVVLDGLSAFRFSIATGPELLGHLALTVEGRLGRRLGKQRQVSFLQFAIEI